MNNLYTRSQASDYLKSLGIRMTLSTLARLSCQGKAPKYAIIGKKSYYKKEWLDEWVDEQMIPIEHPAQYLLNREVR